MKKLSTLQKQHVLFIVILVVFVVALIIKPDVTVLGVGAVIILILGVGLSLVKTSVENFTKNLHKYLSTIVVITFLALIITAIIKGDMVMLIALGISIVMAIILATAFILANK